ncbi:hypothetical protein [Streptomyces sp. NPDC051014]|uniref:hypothetical protein n=1 Tax=Streptomyces sp. NPDC051014 TaxID=3155751 RepID=UPI003411F52C
MTNWLSGMRVTADRLNDHTADATTTSGLVAATDFTVNSFSGRKASGTTTVVVFVQYTGSGLALSSGNLIDTLMCTLPAGWRPPETINATWGDGTESGECTIGTTGQITLRSSNLSIPQNRGIRVTSGWISENT